MVGRPPRAKQPSAFGLDGPGIYRAHGNKWMDVDYRVMRGERPQSWESGPRRNHHATVKPLKLMSYLITLGSRPGDLVLDPFAGTCTTAMAAKILGRDWLMIEIGEEWCQIGGRRVGAVEERLL